MIFRSLAALVFTLGSALLIALLALLGLAPGVPAEARHLREMKNRLETPTRYEAFSLQQHHDLPTGAMLRAYAPFERRAVAVEGYVQRMLVAGDGDLHLELTGALATGSVRDSAYIACEITPGFRRNSPQWRFEPLAEVFRPRHGSATAWAGGPSRVRVSGWLMYDFQYAALPSPWSLEHAAPRLSGWEIHPVTRIERWDESRQAYQEVRR